MTETLHVIVRETPDGFYATSPQAPGFLYGRRDLETLKTEMGDALEFHLERPGPFSVVPHMERHFTSPQGDELVVRVALDDHHADRVKVYERIVAALGVPEQAPALFAGLRNPVGEAVYVCAVAGDTVGLMVEELDPCGDGFTVALDIAGVLLFTFPLAYGETYIDRGVVPIGTRSWTFDTTLGDIAGKTPIVTPTTTAVPHVPC